MDGEYLDYSDKILAYCDALLLPDSSKAAEGIRDEDYVLLIDAFDVLLFPTLATSSLSFMARSPTPIVACAENGIYPEFASKPILL